MVRPRVERLAERTCGLCAKTVGRPHRHGTWQLGRRCRLRHPISDCWAAAMSAVRTVPRDPQAVTEGPTASQGACWAGNFVCCLGQLPSRRRQNSCKVCVPSLQLAAGEKGEPPKLKQDRAQVCLAGATSASAGSCQLQVVVNRGCPSCQATTGQCSCHRPRHR